MFTQIGEFGFDDIVSKANFVVEELGKFSYLNPISCSKGCNIYFKPNKYKREKLGRLFSELEYATHLVTYEHPYYKDYRYYDLSKVKRISNLVNIIKNPDEKVDYIDKYGIAKCRLIKIISEKKKIEVLCEQNRADNDSYKVITFLPTRGIKQGLK